MPATDDAPEGWLDLPSRPRRNRRSAGIRSLVRETTVSPSDLIQPFFIHAGSGEVPVKSMPGCSRLSIDAMLRSAAQAFSHGVPAVILFPAIDPSLKTPGAEESHNEQGIVPRAVRALKKELPGLVVMTDVALDPYSSEGHDGLVGPDGRVLNDATVAVLCRQALAHARAGADVVAPSDMMDGRVRAIRQALDSEGLTEVSLLSYCAKYASASYGPFRDALDSAPRSGDKKTYQMDPANVREALREAALDEAEGADILMVKPAGGYLDVLAALRAATPLPLAGYQVSGEFLMIQAAAAAGWLDRRQAVLESLTGIRRAGADMIVTYFATEAARWLREGD